MTPDFALSLSSQGITLLHRAAGGWRNIGTVNFESADLEADLAALRDKGAQFGSPLPCKIILPNDQIRYLTVETGLMPEDFRNEKVQDAIAAATPYALHELAFDECVEGTQTHVAAVALETLAEAEGFATAHGFHPVSFVAIPNDTGFLGEPYFGTSQAAQGQQVERDGIAVVDIGPAALPEADAETHAASSDQEAPSQSADVSDDLSRQPDVSTPENVAARTPHGAPAPDALEQELAPRQADTPDFAELETTRNLTSDEADALAKQTSADKDADKDPAPLVKPDTVSEPARTSAANPAPATPPQTPAPISERRASRAAEALARHDLPDEVSADTPTGLPDALDFTDIVAKASGIISPPEAPIAAAKNKPAPAEDISDDNAPVGGFVSRRHANRPVGGATRPASPTAPEAQRPTLSAVRRTPPASPASPAAAAVPPATARTAGKTLPPPAVQAALDARASAKQPVKGPAAPFPGTDQANAAGATAQFGSVAPKTSDVPGPATEPPKPATKPAAEPTAKAAGSAVLARIKPKQIAVPADSPLAKQAAAAKAARQSSEDSPPKAARARSQSIVSAIKGKPKYLGLMLTSLLLLCMAVVAAVAFWSETGADQRDLHPNVNDPAARPALSDPSADQAAPQVAPDAEAEPDDVTPAPALILSDANDTHPESAEDLADLELEPSVTQHADHPPIDAAPLTAAIDPETRTDTADHATTTSAAVENVVPDHVMETSYAATGIWQKVPSFANAPGVIDLDDVYVATIDNAGLSHDTVALPKAKQFATDVIQAALVAPSPADSKIAPDDRIPVAATPDRPEDTAQIATLSPAPAVYPRPRPRPADLQEKSERAQKEERRLAELAKVRPRARPRNLVAPAPSVLPDADAIAEAVANSINEAATKQAVVKSVVPRPRPANFARLVARAKATPQPAAEAPAVAVAAAAVVQPKIPSSGSVAREATISNAINLRQVNLLGVNGTASNREALVRLPSGRIKKVKIGDSIDGGRVTAIDEQRLLYQKRGRSHTLRIPNG